MTIVKTISEAEVLGSVALFKGFPQNFMKGACGKTPFDQMKRGFIVLNMAGQPMSVSADIYEIIDRQYGVDALCNNQTFHKSFKTVDRMDPVEYYTHQLMHYFTTYGFEAWGLKANPYVPVEKLEMPEGLMKVERITIVRQLDDIAWVQLINRYAENTVSPSAYHIEMFKPMMHRIGIATDDIKSFELQVIKHDMDGTAPTNPVSVLRYVVYKTTNETLLIKNKYLRERIKQGAASPTLCDIPARIFGAADATQLASIFLRYKPLFLAFKDYPGCRQYINRLRRLADHYHKPLSDVSVVNIGALVMDGQVDKVRTIVNRASNRELVKIANYLGSRLNAYNGDAPGVYNIRNGRTFVRADVDHNLGSTKYRRIYDTLNFVCQTLCNRIAPQVVGKTFIMPDYMDYAAPTTEKQFIGNIPWGSKIVNLPGTAFTAGIQWFDQQGERVDIDLHLNSATQHFGWNAGFRSGNGDVIYTGDMTAAPLPNGAAEAYWFNPQGQTFILSANLYSGPQNTEYKMFLTSVKPKEAYSRDFTFDPAAALFSPVPLNFRDGRDMTIGVFMEDAFYFYGGSVGHGIVPTANYPDYIKGMQNKLQCYWTIGELLSQAGAEVVSTADEIENIEDAIDLTPGALTATTLLDIVDGNLE